MSMEQPPKINRPEDSDKNGDFWEKKYDDGNGLEKTILFCPECGAQIVSTSKGIESGEHTCPGCGFEGQTHQDIEAADDSGEMEKEAA